MELTVPVIQIAVVGIITFGAAIILKPLAMVVRDYLLWVTIAQYIKRSNFKTKAYHLAVARAEWAEHKAQGPLFAQLGQNQHFKIGDKVITFEQYNKEEAKRNRLRSEINELNRSVGVVESIISSLLRHFDQKDSSPALEIIKYYERREFRRRGLEYDEK
ncbi:hypothetical protein [Billgrantia kenyensis]|uniref:Uncharacterized protein n=1 Tax=Billgrantia kenyensis TaxID=321266 RepID=A0A7V9W350_9GAMM|nr:hypothetical protein [Halomonas kenyensis]MBA2780183.1 hypothetical protein [Halomonas kenyensis]MCG6663161.1 hypothetical protein [Halomonas kenyensis]